MNIGNETERVEFKLSTGELKDSMSAICAILNKHCAGELYFGVDDKGYVRGQQISDSTKKDITRIINDAIEPRITPTVEVMNIDEKQVLRVSFSGHNRPYSAYGVYLIRVGTENRKMSTDELRTLIKNEDYSSKWEREMTLFSLDDIDDKALEDFYHNAVNCGRLEMPAYDKLRLLSSLELCTGNRINNAGNALFGKNASIHLKLATFATEDKVTFLDLKMLTGNIYNLSNIAIQYICDRMNWRAEIEDIRRTEIPEIPIAAIREIVINSFAHANYEISDEIEINIHPGKIVIYNPGSFPDDLTPYDFINNNLASYKRNKLLLDVLFRSKDVEKSGTGFQRVNSLCEQNHIGWDFRKEAYGFYFEFIRTNGRINVSKNGSLTKDEDQILRILQDNPGITKSEMAIKINKSERTVQRILSSLTEKKLIVREGSNKKGLWKCV